MKVVFAENVQYILPYSPAYTIPLVALLLHPFPEFLYSPSIIKIVAF